MTIRCRNCHQAVVPDVAMLTGRVAVVCEACQAAFYESEELDEVIIAESAEKNALAVVRPPMPLPQGWTLDKLETGRQEGARGYRFNALERAPKWALKWPCRTLTHTERQRRRGNRILLSVAGVVLFGIANAVMMLSWLWGYLIIALLCGAGLVTAYMSLARNYNRWTLAFSEGELSVQQRPLPWPGARTFASADIEQLYCVRCRIEHIGYTEFRYEVRARQEQGDTVLAANLEKYQHALYIEQLIESSLAIEDQPVAGEAGSRG